MASLKKTVDLKAVCINYLYDYVLTSKQQQQKDFLNEIKYKKNPIKINCKQNKNTSHKLEQNI